MVDRALLAIGFEGVEHVPFLVVWAIAEGRSVTNAVDAHLTGSSQLPSPVHPTALPLAV
ncbi:hypothetical protein SAMN05421805_10295 [Saccharopolyspora antimicrobica]|uniref:Uncharacterized protein n=1 Tax=Saccharopolyspora antimicrobica TaxID=455193 RepID=A0A1I4VAU3_9PSEU|nr:hypothetical protein [Saccharopolyspora antimicrobica]SFM98321.1 hypothetical protein SAMN05421805_10295 [Saccharopolyspora antimicrobica]